MSSSSYTIIFISRDESLFRFETKIFKISSAVNRSDSMVTKTRGIIGKKFAMHLTGWPCTWRNYPHVAISARWRHRWCGKSGLSFSFSFEVLIDDCASLTVPTSITLLARSKPGCLLSYSCIRGYRSSLVRAVTHVEFAITTFHPSSSARLRCFDPPFTFIFRYARQADNLQRCV